MIEIHTPTKKTFKQFDMHAEFNTFRNQVTSMLIFHFHNSYIKLVPEINSSASLCNTNVACGYVLWVVTISSVPWHSQTS